MASQMSVHHNLSRNSQETWKDVVLNSEINLESINQSYDVIFLVEKTETGSKAVANFYYGSTLDPLNEVKLVAYDEILQNIREFSVTPLPGHRPVEHMYNMAATESMECLNTIKVLSTSLMAALIKLQMMFLLDNDVVNVHLQLQQIKDVQAARQTLIDGDKKPKAKFDPCDLNVVYHYRSSSTFKATRKSVGAAPLRVPPKHMFFVVIGFYDFELLKELFTFNIPVTGFVELVEPETNYMCGDNCENSECDITESIKEQVLKNFWYQFYKYFEAEDYLECFDNVCHMTIQPFKDAFNSGETDEKLRFDVFIGIGGEIVKILDVQRQHANYIRNLKISKIKAIPKRIPVHKYSLYNNIFNLLPEECFSIQMIVDAMLDELNGSPSNEESTVFRKRSTPLITNKYHYGIKYCIADVLGQNIKVECSHKNATNEDQNPKICLAITRNRFMVDANNDNYMKSIPYEGIRKEYLLRNQHLLEKCFSTLLWKRYLQFDEMKVLASKFHLKTIADDLDIDMQELQYVVHAILFSSIKCYKKNPLGTKSSLESLFPQLEDTSPNITSFTDDNNHVATPISVDLMELNVKVPNATYCDEPNAYEANNTANYKWYEKLTADIMVQELYKVEKSYLCLDFKYCTFDDTILLRFHNNLDDFGINRRTWSESLRTCVGINEFCKYIVHEDSAWLAEQERKYVDAFEEEYENRLKLDALVREKVYPKLEFTDADFIQPGSFKSKQIKRRSTTHSKGHLKSRSKIVMTGLSQLSLPTEIPARKKLSVHCAKSPPYSFFAYDLSKKRISLTGSTIVFCSQDGVKVTVDQTRFLRLPHTMSVNVTADGHSLVLHKNNRTLLEPFTFHFCLADYTVIAFAKPHKPQQPEDKLCDSIYQKMQEDTLDKRQNLFFICDRQRFVLKCFDIPFITKKHLILSEEILPSFLNKAKMRGIPVKYVPARESFSTNEFEDLNNILKSSHSVTSKDESFEEKSNNVEGLNNLYKLKLSKKQECQSIYKSKCANQFSDNGKESQTDADKRRDGDAENGLGLKKKSLVAHDSKSKKLSVFEDIEAQKVTRRKLTQEIRSAMVSQSPIYKICSSRLHRSQYVKRVKSYAEVNVGSILRRIQIKPRLQEAKRHIHITKLLPIKPLIIRNYPKYEMKLSLPSGLSLESIAGFDNDPFCIRQFYGEKGPQCKNIISEVSRTYMRNGTLLIKNTDGNFRIVYVNGQIINCTLPKYRENLNKECDANFARKVHTYSNLTYLHTYGSKSSRFKKYFQRVLRRLDKRTIRKDKPSAFSSYSKCKSRKLGISPDIIYLLQTTIEPFTKFSLITSDGKKLKVTKTAVVKEKKFYTTVTNEYRYEEIFLNREDGTHMIFNRDSELYIQFPDGTRITSWINIEDDLVYALEETELSNKCHENKCEVETQISFSKDDSFSSPSLHQEHDDGWVSIVINFKFEHPNYATVIFHGVFQNAEIILPGNLKILVSKEGEYDLDVSNTISASITTSAVVFEAHLCNTCLQKCTTTVNVNPLYEKVSDQVNNPEVKFLQVTDSFNKKFVVNYDGQCFNNTDYISGRCNAVHCPLHNPFEYQKLFLLKRNLNGCKFWDIAAYRRKVKTTMDNDKTVVNFHTCDTFQTYYSTTFKTSIYQPIDELYLLPYDHPNLLMTKLKTDVENERQQFYTKKQFLKCLPELTKILSIYKALQNFLCEKGLDTFSSTETILFLVSILEQGTEEEKRKEVYQENLGNHMPDVVETIPPISLSERWHEWRKEVIFYLSLVKGKNVPQYVESKLRKTLMEKDGRETSDVKIVEENESKTVTENSDAYSDEVEKNVDENADQIVQEAKKLSIVVEENDEEAQECVEEPIVSPKEQPNMIYKTKREQLFEIPLAVEILRDLILRYAIFMRDVDVDDGNECTESKVQYVGEKIFANIIEAANQFLSIPKEDLISITSKILVDNISMESLNTFEMYSLLDYFTFAGSYDDICKYMYDSSFRDCLEEYKVTRENYMRRKSRLCESETDSAFKIYSSYAFKSPDVVTIDECPLSSKARSLTIVYEAPEEREESVERIVPEKNKFLLRSSYTNLLVQVPDFCQKCVDKNEFYKVTGESKDKFRYSLSSCETESSSQSPSSSNVLVPPISQDSAMHDDLTSVDSRTYLLERFNFIPPESMRVLFSKMSLKGKDIENGGPYAERPPSLIEENLVSMTIKNEKRNELEIEELGSESGCTRCIPRQREFVETDKIKTVNTQSVTKIFKHIKSGNLVPITQNHDEKSLPSLLENVPEKTNKTHVIARVGNTDMEYIMRGCPPTYDPAVKVKEGTLRRTDKAVRKTVGMVTQPGTLDNVTQT